MNISTFLKMHNDNLSWAFKSANDKLLCWDNILHYSFYFQNKVYFDLGYCWSLPGNHFIVHIVQILYNNNTVIGLFSQKRFLETISGDVHQAYAMDKPRRGLALIFNNDEFDSPLKLARRSGSGTDVRQLKKQLKKLGFDVYVYANLCSSDLKRAIKLGT